MRTFFYDDNLHRCSISADSEVENYDSEDLSDGENLDIKDNGYHDAENEVDPDTDDDLDLVMSGELNESSGYGGSDLYEFKAVGGDNSEGATSNKLTSSANMHQPVNSKSLRESKILFNEQQAQERPNENVMDSPSNLPGRESHRLMGEILSSMDQGIPQSVVGAESYFEKSMNKLLTSSGLNVKRSTFWGRSLTRKMPSMESVDSSEEKELAIPRLELAKNDLRNRIAKEVMLQFLCSSFPYRFMDDRT